MAHFTQFHCDACAISPLRLRDSPLRKENPYVGFHYRLIKYRQKRVTLKEVLSLVFRILVILEKIFNLFKIFPF